MIKRLLRWYLYARRGLGHIGAVLSGVTFVNTVYLISRDWAVVGDLGYLELMAVGFLVLVPVIVFIGRLDYKRGYYQVESSIAVEENPYMKYLFTVKERELLLPLSLAVADYLAFPSEETRLKLEEARKRLESAINA